MDDTIKSEDDIENYLGLTTLASIPDRKRLHYGKKDFVIQARQHRRKKKKKEEK